MPSLDRDSAQLWATSWAAAREASAERRARQQPAGPPDDEHVWLDTATAAVVVGFTVPWMRRLAEMERAPATKVGTRGWWRRDLVEAYGAARAAERNSCAVLANVGALLWVRAIDWYSRSREPSWHDR